MIFLLFLLLFSPSLADSTPSLLTFHTPLETLQVPVMTEEKAMFVQVAPLLKALKLAYSFKNNELVIEEEKRAQLNERKGQKGVQVIYFRYPLTRKEGSLYMDFSDLMRWLDITGVIKPETGEAYLYGKVLSFVQQDVGGGMNFALTASAPFQIKPFFLTGPIRYVIDMTPLIYPLPTKKAEIHIGSFSSLRASQFQAHPEWITRVVIEEEKALPPLLRWENNQKTLIIAFFHQVEKVTWEEKKDTLEVKVSYTGNLSLSSFSLSQPHRIVLDLAPALLSEKKKEITVKKGKLTRIRLAQFQYSPSIVRLVLDLDGPVQYEVIPDIKKVTISIEKKYVPLAKALLVLDAGHGGEDPGALSPYGFKEKDINLEITQKLAQHLQKEGLRTYLTRDGDFFIPLYDRPKIANEKNSVLFVSIHCNALPPKPEIRGSEVYYYNDFSLLLAQEISAALAEDLPTPHRGIKKAGFVVIKYTRMPAVLVEVAYVTNKQDAILLQDTNFQEQVASKIASGILAYLKKYPPTIEQPSAKEQEKEKKLDSIMNER